ncbi:hypothetical protein CTEN210_11642 [Chaetoceros tenuissimus]|uniref:Uncharacterized protein n=1 Tax=Chaetoceros tenuissimus TaxID=426638 RepID=A0AAD3CZR9_9STRA|nr:hypothetical protein CTEN210_11642 [Chaetoceros tenuissimus]
MPSSNPNSYIEHITDIEAPIDVVWKVLFDVNDWEWNKWTRLEANSIPAEGVKGNLNASYDGNDEWETFDFNFGEVSSKDYILQWLGSVGPSGCLFSGVHTMELEVISEHKTRLIHSEKFGGLLPALGLGLPYETLDRNYLLMNESLKKFVETKVIDS